MHVPVLLSKVKIIPATKLSEVAKTMSPDPTYPYEMCRLLVGQICTCRGQPENMKLAESHC